MTRYPTLPAGDNAGKAHARPEFGQEKALLVAGQGWYFVRTEKEAGVTFPALPTSYLPKGEHHEHFA